MYVFFYHYLLYLVISFQYLCISLVFHIIFHSKILLRKNVLVFLIYVKFITFILNNKYELIILGEKSRMKICLYVTRFFVYLSEILDGEVDSLSPRIYHRFFIAEQAYNPRQRLHCRK